MKNQTITIKLTPNRTSGWTACQYINGRCHRLIFKNDAKANAFKGLLTAYLSAKRELYRHKRKFFRHERREKRDSSIRVIFKTRENAATYKRLLMTCVSAERNLCRYMEGTPLRIDRTAKARRVS